RSTSATSSSGKTSRPASSHHHRLASGDFVGRRWAPCAPASSRFFLCVSIGSEPLTLGRTCGQAAIALLERYGVDTVFGMPGVHTLELYRGLIGSRVRHISVR